MKSSAPPIQRSKAQLDALPEGRRFKGTEWTPGTLHTAEDGVRYMTLADGSFKRVVLAPVADSPGHHNIAFAGKLKMTGRQRKKLNKYLRRARGKTSVD